MGKVDEEGGWGKKVGKEEKKENEKRRLYTNTSRQMALSKPNNNTTYLINHDLQDLVQRT